MQAQLALERAVLVIAADTPSLGFAEKSGQPRVFLSVSEKGGARLTLRDEQGEVVLTRP